MKRILQGLLFLIWATQAVGASSWYTQDIHKNVILNVTLFLSTTCAHCHKAEAFFQKIETQYPWLRLKKYYINQDKGALVQFDQLLDQQKMKDFSVPSVFFCNSRWVGFASEQTTGKDLIHGLVYCKQQIEKEQQLNETTINVLRHWANANLFDANKVSNPSIFTYIISMAFMDSLNPCSLFCLAGFFALLFMQENQQKQILSGSLFIVIIGLIHYFQQTHANLFFQSLLWLRIPAIVTGLFIFYWAGQYNKNRPNNSLFFLLTFLLAFMVQFYQQTCLMNWSYVFEQWLNNQQLSYGRQVLYQLIYQVLYVVPLIFIFMVYLVLQSRKFFTRLKPFLKNMGVLLVLAIALCLVVYPLALSSLALSVAVILTLIICSWFLTKFETRI